MDKLVSLVRDYPNQISAFVAICALLVSFLSIFLTVRALRLHREHNFKSLTPIGSITIGDYENNVEVKVRNSGVGPLIVEQFLASVASDPNQRKADLISWMPNQPDGIFYTTFTASIDGWCIAPNTELVIIQLEGDPDDERFASFRNEVRSTLSELIVTLKYKDIYDRRMPTNERHLAWFARDTAALDFNPTKQSSQLSTQE